MEIPDEVKKEHYAICKKCPYRKRTAKMVDMHFDWLDCPYNCENDYEHWEGAKWKECEDG